MLEATSVFTSEAFRCPYKTKPQQSGLIAKLLEEAKVIA
jgi:hypothetical protein